MELKETIEELKLINDINTKSLEELAEEYLSSEEKCDDFFNEYGQLFFKKIHYQLRVSENYEKILDLLNYGKIMYPKENNEMTFNEIDQIIKYNLKNYDLRGKVDDLGQSQTLFINDLGADKCRTTPKYDKIVTGIYNAALNYSDKGKYDIKDFKSFIDLTRFSYDQMSVKRAINKYIYDHPLMKECKDVNYLYFVNYMLRKDKDLIDDKEFIEDAIDVIEASMILFDYDSLDDKEKINKYKDYKKVAKFTLKNIKKIGKENLKNYNKEKKLLRK